MKFPYRITPNAITVLLNGKTHSITRDTKGISFDQVADAIKKQDFDLVASLIDPKTAIAVFTHGKATVMEDGSVKVNGIDLHPVLVDRMQYLMREGYDFKPLARFIDNLASNPIPTAVNELFLFLEKCDLAITDDGHFIAYKKVNQFYRDIYSNSVDNSIGTLVSVPESEVDTDRDNTCSRGLHFCSESYLRHYGSSASDDKVVLVKINPKDVRAIPSDYQNAKGRCTKYLVIGEVGSSVESAVKSNAVVTTPEVSEKDNVAGVGLRKEVTVAKTSAVLTSDAATKAGYLRDGKVKILYGKAVQFTTTNPKAVVRSWETKSVKAAVREAMQSVVAAPKPTSAAKGTSTASSVYTGAVFSYSEICSIFNIWSNIEFDRIKMAGNKFIQTTGGYRII